MAKRNRSETRANDEENIGSKILSIFFVILIVAVWLAIIAALIKFDIGGFGSSVLRPVLKDVPGINKILPAPSSEELEKEAAEKGEGDQIATLSQAKEMIEKLKEENSKLNCRSNKAGRASQSV